MAPAQAQVLRAALERARSQTISVEERFKRSRQHSATNAGSVPSLSTICSNHIASEAASLHSQVHQMTGTIATSSSQQVQQVPHCFPFVGFKSKCVSLKPKCHCIPFVGGGLSKVSEPLSV